MKTTRFDWTKTIKPNILILKFSGPWPFSYHPLSRLYSTCVVFLMLHLCATLQAIELFFFTKGTKLFLGASCLVLQEFQQLVKTYSIFKHHNFLEHLMEFLNSEKLFQPKTETQENFIHDGLSLWWKNFIVLNIAAFNTAFFWTMFPILDNLTGQHELPFRCWFPYDVTISPNYEISYSYEFVHLWIAAFVTHNVDTLVTGLMTFIGLQCDLLCDNLRNLGHNKGSDIENEFNECIQHHKKILKFSEECNNYLSLIVFVQVATISTCIGLCLLQFTFTRAFTTEFYHIFFYGTTILLQIFQYCWFGNEVLIKSSNIPCAAFQMNIIDAPLHVQKSLVFFIARTQRPIKVPVFKLTYLSLELFVKILRTAWSYFTLLDSVSEKN